MKETNIKDLEVSRKKILVLQTDSLLNEEQKARIVQPVKKQIEKDGAVFIPYGFKTFSLDATDLHNTEGGKNESARTGFNDESV